MASAHGRCCSQRSDGSAPIARLVLSRAPISRQHFVSARDVALSKGAHEDFQDEDTMTPTSATEERTEQAADKTAIRPFRVNVPEAELTELRRRINATRWPERETVADQSQGVQLATMQRLARYWATDYDWRKCRGETERPAALHHRDRWAGHSFHSRSFET